MIPLAMIGPVVAASSFLRFLKQRTDARSFVSSTINYTTSSDDDEGQVEEGHVEEDVSIASSHIHDVGIFDESDISCTTYDDFSLSVFKNVLGPEVALDSRKHKLPKDLQKPKNLEYSMNMDLPVGYYRLRRALLSSRNDFWENIVLNETLKYTR